MIVDADGIAWYSSFGEQYLGKLDPKTARSRNFRSPLHKPGFPTGTLGLRADRDGNLWLGNMYQAGIVKFDRKSETFEYLRAAERTNIDAAQVNMVSPQASHVDGKLWTQNNGFAGVHRLDLASGKIETCEPFKAAPKGEPHNIYDVIPDSKNNAYFTDFRQRQSDASMPRPARSSSSRYRPPASAPRRGMMDAQDRLWFGEFRGDRIGMFDTKTETFKEWLAPTPWSAPYDVDDRQERRSLDRLDVDRPHDAAESRDAANSSSICCRVDQHPPRLRRQLDDPGHLLGRQQPRRLDHQAGAAGLVMPKSDPIDLWFSIGSMYTFLTGMRIDRVEDTTDVRFVWRPFRCAPS